MDVRVELWRKLSTEELMLLNCGVGEDSLRVPWTASRSNQSILKEINPEYSLEGLMLELMLQYFGHLMQRADSLEKNPDAGKDWRQKEKGAIEDKMIGWHHQFNGHEFEQAPGIYDGKFISHARILEWVTFPFARGSSQPRDQTQVSRIAGKCFTSWATRKALGYCS